MKTSFFVRSVLCACMLSRYFACAQQLQPGREHIRGAESLMGTVQTPAGYPLQVFVTKPAEQTGTKLPILFVAAWLSCDSTEAPMGPTDGFTKLLFDLAGRSGFVTYRVDKPGTGGSGGPKCGDLDFTTELQAYRTAFAATAAASRHSWPRKLPCAAILYSAAGTRRGWSTCWNMSGGACA